MTFYIVMSSTRRHVINLRRKTREPSARHDDFDWSKSTTPPGASTAPINPKFWRKYCAKIREGWDFGICLWGAVGRQEEVHVDMPGQRMLIRDASEHGKVKEIMAEIDYHSLPTSWMGAPNINPVDIIHKYEEKKQEWIQQKKL
jgi:hypothetical protein